MSRLLNKRTLITGGTTGIGLETARQFLAEGARVVITGSNPETLAQARIELGNEVVVLKSDAGSVPDQKALVAVLKEKFDRIDSVFLNAGVAEFRPIEAFDESAYDRMLAINLKGPFFLMQSLLPILANPASIILNTSINARMGVPNSSVYAASKAGLISMARTLSGELISRGIRINAISPGPISTPIYGKLGLRPDQLRGMAGHLRSHIPAGRFGSAVEIAKAVVFFASDESLFIVGSELVIDGGMSNI